LIKNVAGNNQKVGIYGISYPGFYATCAIIDSHPALKAASPQAPVTDWFVGDDVTHNGAFFLSATFNFFSSFGQVRPAPTSTAYAKRVNIGTPDAYRFFLQEGNTFDILTHTYLKDEIPVWNDFMQHGTYDAFWQSRTPLPHLQKVKPAVLTVGGWFDAEDMYGPLKTYAAIKRNDPSADNRLVMGPWPHGGWARGEGASFGYVHFDSPTSAWYRENIELPFFNYYLKGKAEGDFKLANVHVFETGSNVWRTYDTWPPADVKDANLYLGANGNLAFSPSTTTGNAFDEYVSDPAKPVPFTAQITASVPREYLIEDQRFVANRPDVLVYQTTVLEKDLTFSGPVNSCLYVSTTGTDADFVVKLIDVYPDSTPNYDDTPTPIKLGGFQQLVRGDVIRGKFRQSLSAPVPFEPGQPTEVKFELQDIAHTFKAGHRIMVQIQSSWFPLVDRNPNTFLDIYHAKASDYKKASHRIYLDGKLQSFITLKTR